MAYKPSSDKILFITTGLLTIFGLVMVYSASSVVAASQHGMSSYFFLRQLLYAGFGFLLLMILMNVDYHFWQRPKVIRTILIICAVILCFRLDAAEDKRRPSLAALWRIYFISAFGNRKAVRAHVYRSVSAKA